VCSPGSASEPALTPPALPGGLRIGLTGGIGSGKSTVATMLAELGAHLVDTDAIARRLTLPGGAALPALAQHFGSEILTATGALDRDRLRALVFQDPAAKRALEALLHPLITAQALAEAGQARPGQPVVFDVPLLAESGHWRARVHRVLVVDCPAEVQVQRVMARSGWPEAQVRQVIASQASRAQRRALADAVILNDGLSLPELREQVRLVWQGWNDAPLPALPG
jgi:dephospho-CoA kinase